MAVSNSYDFTLTASGVVKKALMKLGILQTMEEPTSDQMQDGLDALTMLLASMVTEYNLWRFEEATLFITPGTESYVMDGSSSRAVSNFVQTTTSADASDTDTTVDLTSVVGVADTYVIGIQTSSSDIHWTTVSGAPSGSTVTLSDALDADVSSGATVYVYPTTNFIVRPLRIEQIRRRNSSQDTPLHELDREEYFMLPNKSTQSTVTQWYYDPGRDSGTLYVWPTSSTVNDTLKITYVRPMMDVDTTTDNLDVPREWLLGIIYTLAITMASDFGIAVQPELAAVAASLEEALEGWDNSPVSLKFQPSRGW